MQTDTDTTLDALLGRVMINDNMYARPRVIH